jgi:hypothetical protein
VNEHYKNWNRLSPLGLLIIGMGLSFTGDAIISKSKGKGWFLKGTIGLILVNAGVAIFGEAVKERALYESEVNSLRRQKHDQQASASNS